MKIDGQFAFDSISPLNVWEFLTDANRIAECLPGCEKLVQTGDDTYDMEMRFGIGAISGVFRGSIRLHGLRPTSEYQMTVDGSGTPGFIRGTEPFDWQPRVPAHCYAIPAMSVQAVPSPV